ncbi:MAG: carbohydrate kinase [Planctomycetales bacterium]|nr:carbohydrate kinase [Planctomycetales bacterium]
MADPNVIVGLGEVLWDLLPDGARFGGAPANFACSSQQVAQGRYSTAMASAVGKDALGDTALQELRQRGVDISCVAQNDYPTGQVHVSLDENGKASYRFEDNCAWDNLTWTDEWNRLAASTAAVCFGSLGQRCEPSRHVIRRFVESTPTDSLRIFDINLRWPFVNDQAVLDSLERTNVLKLSDEELPYLAKLCQFEGSPETVLHSLATRYQLRQVALTCGEDGALFWSHGKVFRSAGINTNVVDTIGAGDAFTATMAVGLLDGMEPQALVEQACRVAAYVCSQSGATPPIPL